MSTQLPNGTVVLNATPHPLYFLCGDTVVTAESDGVISAIPVTHTEVRNDRYELTTVQFVRSAQGKALLRAFREVEPDALVVGSMIAAQAYPGEVVASIPAYSARLDKYTGAQRLVRSDRFTVFKENKNGC